MTGEIRVKITEEEYKHYPLKTVCIPACEEHEGIHALVIKLRWVCPVCGQPRGTIKNVRSYDGSLCLCCNGWENPCGHIDKYSAVRREAKTNGLNPGL